nr:Mlp family lipoprotein [Borrelia sp. BU AG58]
MRYVGILFASLSIILFGCRLYLVKDDCADGLDAGERTARKRAAERVVSLKDSLKDTLEFLYGDGGGAPQARQKEFFEWLENNDPDHSKRKELADSMGKVYGLIKENAKTSKEIKEIIDKANSDNDEGMKRAGIKSPDDLKTDAQVDALVKYVVGTDEEWELNSGSSAIKAFFEELGGVFDDSLAGSSRGNGDNKSRTNEEVFEDFKKLFSDDGDSEFDTLKYAFEENKKSD